MRPTARPDSAFECFPGSVISEWTLHVTDSFELPVQLLKCILLLKNKRNNLYSLTKVLKKNELFGLSADIPKLILSLQILVFYLQIFIVTSGGDLIKLKGVAPLEAETTPTNSHTGTHTCLRCTSM